MFLKGKVKLSHILISGTCMLLTTAKEISEAPKQTYSRIQDATQIYEIITRITATKQGNSSVIE